MDENFSYKTAIVRYSLSLSLSLSLSIYIYIYIYIYGSKKDIPTHKTKQYYCNYSYKMEFLPRNKSNRTDELSRLIPKFSESIEDIATAVIMT